MNTGDPFDGDDFCIDCWERAESGIAILTFAELCEEYRDLRVGCTDQD